MEPSKIFVLNLLFFSSALSRVASAEHLINLTRMANCDELTEKPIAYVIEARPEMDPVTNLIKAYHAKFNWTKVDTGPRIVTMIIFKCPKGSMGSCISNPTVHQETLSCKRFMEDDSGPWHMYSSSMSGSKCGDEVGTFSFDFTSLKIDHLIQYLDVNDEQFRRFRINIIFESVETLATIACGHLEFELLKIEDVGM